MSKGLLLVLMEPPAPLEEEFNDWYDTEHFPQRRALPGFLTASRWVCLDGWPRWAALYDLDSTAVLETPEYRAVSGANSTPWSKRVLPRTLGRERLVYGQDAADGALTRTDSVRLVIARYPGRLAAPDASPAGCLSLRAFHGGDETLLLAEFDRPVRTELAMDAFCVVADTPARMLNIYARYLRG
jgi:hypothetical protein